MGGGVFREFLRPKAALFSARTLSAAPLIAASEGVGAGPAVSRGAPGASHTEQAALILDAEGRLLRRSLPHARAVLMLFGGVKKNKLIILSLQSISYDFAGAIGVLHSPLWARGWGWARRS